MKRRDVWVMLVDVWIMLILVLVGIAIPFVASFYGAQAHGYPNPFRYFELGVIAISILSLPPILTALLSFWILAKRLPFPFSAIPAMGGYYWLFQMRFFKDFEKPLWLDTGLGFAFAPPVIAVVIMFLFLLMLPFYFLMKKWRKEKSSELTSLPVSPVPAEKKPFWQSRTFTVAVCFLLFPPLYIFWGNFYLLFRSHFEKNFHISSPFRILAPLAFNTIILLFFIFVKKLWKDRSRERDNEK